MWKTFQNANCRLDLDTCFWWCVGIQPSVCSECGWPPNLQEETLEGGEGAEQTERGEGQGEDEQQQHQQEEETIECYVEKRYSECVALFRAILKTDANSRKMALLRLDNKFFSPFNRNYPRMFKLRRQVEIRSMSKQTQ